MKNKLEFTNSAYSDYYTWEKRDIIYTSYYDWLVHLVITNHTYYWNKYTITKKHTWEYYDTFIATSDISYWNYYEPRYWYSWNRYQARESNYDKLYLYSNQELSIENWLEKYGEEQNHVSFISYDPSTGDRSIYLKLYNVDGTTLIVKTPPEGERLDLSDYYNNGYFAVGYDWLNYPQMLLRSNSYLVRDYIGGNNEDDKFVLYSTPTVENCYERIVGQENLLGWGAADSNFAYNLEIDYSYTTQKGDYIDTLDYPDNRNLLPDNGVLGSYYYVYVGCKVVPKNTTIIGTLYSEDRNAYPDSGSVVVDNQEYAIKYDRTDSLTGERVKGNYIGDVISTDSTIYPADGIQNDYWYIYKGELDFQGDFIESVSDTALTYPENGSKDSYYYVLMRTDTEYSKGEYFATYTSVKADEYPIDGKQEDYWYVFDKERVVAEKGSIVLAKVKSLDESAYPADGIQDDYWYVSSDIEKVYEKTLTDSEIIGGVEYQIDISQNTDFSIGSTPSAEISLTINQTEEDSQWYLNQPCIYSVKFTDNADWKQIGIFNITSIQKKDKISCRLTGYDNMIKLDRYVDSYINNLNYPLSLGTITTGLIQYCNLEYEDLDLCNSNYQMKQNFDITNITGREVLGYLAESNGCFAYCLPNGKITLKKIGYNSAIQDLDNSKYSKFSNDLYQVNPIDRVIVKQSEDDIGVYYPSTGTSNNPYIIAGNPVLLADSESAIYIQVKNIYDYVKGISYYPAELELFEDFDIQIGQYVNVNSKKILVLSKKITNKGVSISSTGNQKRQTADSINSQLSMLRGKSNQLVRDIEKTQSTITDNTNKLQSQITQTASSLETKITDNYNNLQSQITQSASGIETNVENQISGINSTITQKFNSINSTIQSQDGRINSIEQTLDGVVYDNGSGTTVINGDNITTGTISADRINMTGSISWGDLDSTTQNYINGLGGSDVVLPSYIKSTYIDSTQILSPTISAGTLNGTTINIEKSAYIYDADVGKKVRFIYNSLDNSSDARLRIGRCSTTSYTNKYNSIDFFDMSSYRYIELRSDEVNILNSGISETDSYGRLNLEGLTVGGRDSDSNNSYIGTSTRPFKLIYGNNFCVGTTTTTSNAYCGFSSNKYLQKYSGSSERHKHNIHSLNDDLKSRFNSLYDLEVKNWTYNDDYIDPNDQLYQKETFGLIAEDVEKVLPEFVVYDNGQVDNYRDRNLLNAMLVLIQEQKKKIDELELLIQDINNKLEGANK